MNYGLVSVIIPLIVIFIAIFTKKIITSLIIGILTGGLFLAKGNIIEGVLLASEHLIKSTANEQSIYIIFFLFLFGAFGEIMKVSGGVKGFTQIASKYVKGEKSALWSIWAITPVTFIDCCFHGISAGTVGKALIDKVQGSRRKLAFILNVTSCLLIILIPFGTTYIGYIIGVIGSAFSTSGIDQSAYSAYMQSIPFNFYAIVMCLISIAVLQFGLRFDRDLKTKGKERAENDDDHTHDEAHEQCSFAEKAPPRPFNLILPLAVLILTTFFLLWYTGKDKGNSFWAAILNADFEKSIFVSGLITLVITSIFYLVQKIPLKEIESHFLSGGNEMMPPIIVLILSWGLSSIISDLGFTDFITGVVSTNIPGFLIPASIFLIGCFTSYFMGTAWGTWALIMPIAVPLAVSTNSSMALVIGAVLAGGSLGDNASPLGETAILSSTISDVPLMEHVKSELPYCLVGVGISTILFVVAALLF